MYTRRDFLRTSLLASAGMCLPRIAFGGDGGSDSVLVCVFQRGAADGLSMLVPYAEPNYYDLRKSIAIAEPGKGPRSSLAIDDRFALHPSLRPFWEMYQEKRLVAIPACGSPVGTRSHFDAQDFMESGVAGSKQVHDGWMNRAMAEQEGDSPFEGLSMTTTLPRTLRGDESALNIPSISQYEIGYGKANGSIQRDDQAATLLRELYGDSALANSTAEAFKAVEALRNRKYKNPQAQYPEGEFSRQMMELAQLIKSDLGVKMAFVEIGGWDTHANQGGAVGPLAGNLYQLGHGIRAFFEDIGAKSKKVVLVTMSEFGRTVKQNGNYGTDHGHGTTFFAMGAVKGGRVLGDFPGLSKDRLYQGRDVAVTTDYRDVLAELLHRHMSVGSLDRIFPGFDASQQRYPGVLG